MADFSISEALGVGTGLLTRKPLAVLAWGVLPVIVIVPFLLLFAGTLIAVISEASRAGADQSAIAAAILPQIGALFLFVLLAIVIAWVLSAMIGAAAYRAVLHPEQSGFAYLRFGSQELWLMAVGFVMGLVFFGIGLALSIPQAIVNLAMLNSDVGPRITAVLLFTLAREVITIWIWLRLSMALPMTFAQRKFQLFESWAITRGHTLQLLGFSVLAIVMLSVVNFVVLVVGVGGTFALAGGAIAAARANPQAFFASPQAVIAAAGPALGLWAVLLVITSGVSTAIFRAPFAHIYRSLAGEDAAATFT
ncbi:MAG TPA: hypothetical protein VN805_00300 [Caulobacteraceae bacterium]|nr:hypothetical protein [Caulobacteraceae bacterium]